MATPYQLSLSSSFLPSSLPKTTVRKITNSIHRLIIFASSSYSPTFRKTNQWKTNTTKESSKILNNNKKKGNPLKGIKRKGVESDRIVKSKANTVSEALSEAIVKKQWHYALQVFEMLKKQPFYQPKQKTYMKLLSLLGRSGQPGQACRLFDEMLEEGIEPTSELYTALLSACCRSNLIDKALSVLNQMKSHSQCQPDLHTFSILIKACIDAGRFELVEPLYDQMAQLLITPTTAMQNIVIAGYGKAGKYKEMEKILTKMLDGSASDPDVWTMNSVLTLFGNEGQIEMMEMWYEKFRDIGIEPESRTFNILISAYGRKGMYDKMSSVMEYMRRLSFAWTTSTYNSVIEAFSNAGDAENMEYTFEQMQAEGIKADTKTFCCLIKGYANGGLFRKVVSSVQLAGQFEIPENTTFFNAVIYACSRKEDLVEMENIFQRMKNGVDGICKLMVVTQGFGCEEHKVTTKDGYILSLQRIPNGRDGGKSDGAKIPVLLQHGLMSDASTWLSSSPDESLGFILADNNYDVWLANVRGTKYSQGHVSLKPDDAEFWDWSWDELVSYDLPASFQYVHEQTGQKVHYVGHSLGTLMAFGAFSKQEVVNTVRSAALLSPIAFMGQMPSPLARAAADAFLAEVVYWLGVHEFAPGGGAASKLVTDICSSGIINCSDLESVITGPNCCLNTSRPSPSREPTSTKNMVHLAQMIRDGTIEMYDYGSEEKNNDHYGQSSPPAYNMASIPNDLPLFLAYGGQDLLSDVEDVQTLINALAGHDPDKLVELYREDYAHLDFVGGVNAKQVVYDPLMAFFKLN